MKITTVDNKNSPTFKNLWTNKAVLKGLETISEHGTTFIAGTTLVMASGIRPLVISKTPGVEKENKQYLTANSIISGLTKFLMVEAIALPIENAIKNIDKTPEKYLAQKTIETFKGSSSNIAQSEGYKFATQFLKLSAGLISAIPKSMLTIALLPILMNKLFPEKQVNKTAQTPFPKQEINKIFAPIQTNPVSSISFKGSLNNIASKGIGKIIDNKLFQDFVQKNKDKAPDIARNMSMATDILLTASYIHRTKRSKNIKESQKNTLIYNNLIATGLSVLGGYTIDKAVKKGTKKLIDKFSELNKNDPKLPKYIEGINILRPTLIFAGLYYILLPIATTYLTDKTDKLISNQKDNKLSEQNFTISR